MLELYQSLVDIEPLLHKPVRQMSLGQRTLSDILAAFLHNPKIVFLDEPTIGLDVSMKAKIRTLIHALNQEKNTTVILTTHDMGDVDALCRRIIIIDKGKMLYDNDIEHLKGFFGSYRTLKIRIDGDMRHHAEQIQKEFPAFSVSADEEWIIPRRLSGKCLLEYEKILPMAMPTKAVSAVQIQHQSLVHFVCGSDMEHFRQSISDRRLVPEHQSSF